MSLKLTVIDNSGELARALSRILKDDKPIIQFISSPPFFDEVVQDSIRQFSPNFVVLDLALEGDVGSGFRVLRQLKERSDFKNIRVVVCSKYIADDGSGEQNRQTALGMGAAVVFTKVPFPTREEFLGAESAPRDETAGGVNE